MSYRITESECTTIGHCIDKTIIFKLLADKCLVAISQNPEYGEKYEQISRKILGDRNEECEKNEK